MKKIEEEDRGRNLMWSTQGGGGGRESAASEGGGLRGDCEEEDILNNFKKMKTKKVIESLRDENRGEKTNCMTGKIKSAEKNKVRDDDDGSQNTAKRMKMVQYDGYRYWRGEEDSGYSTFINPSNTPSESQDGLVCTRTTLSLQNGGCSGLEND